jgi:tetratricopeptide (TPR) repeat protein
LCEAHAMAGDYDNAQLTIQEGLDRCTRNSSACRRLTLALSFVKELRASRDRADPRAAVRRKKSERAYCVGIITNSGSVSACESLLLSEPKDEALYKALATKLLKLSDGTKAAAYILRAREEFGQADLFADLYGQAIRLRRSGVDSCLDNASLQKCEQAYMSGTSDEYLILQRRGELLTQEGDYRLAKQALDRASLLKPNDAGVSAALAALERAQTPAVVIEPKKTAEPVKSKPLVAKVVEAAKEPTVVTQPPPLARNAISAAGASL